MKIDKSLLSGSTKMLVLSLLKDRDKYGYEMISQLSLLSKNVFDMKEGTLYPVLHSLESEGCVRSYDQKTESGRSRRYYHLTDKGARQLAEQTEQWEAFSGAVNMVLRPEG
ncbi:MAG: helix-turn-helix transcriptional regulator [Firmicutes bacterium]|nr:helix-turn-helix transcriptional regulator [Bacillota bacterium]